MALLNSFNYVANLVTNNEILFRNMWDFTPQRKNEQKEAKAS